MSRLSRSTYIGRLTRDPELKKVMVKGEEVSVCNFSIAVDKEIGEGRDFYNIVTWRGLADNVARFLQKGRLVYVEGRASTRKYTITKEGVEFDREVTETHADRVDFLDSGNATKTQDEPALAVASGDDGQPW